MRRPKVLAALALLLALWLVPASVPLRAQPSSPPLADTEFVNALWIAESGGLLEVATADGTVRLEVAEPQGIRVVAVDDRQGVAWAYGAGVLRAYAFRGTPLRSLPLPPVKDDHEDEAGVDEDDETGDDGPHVALVVNSREGSAWLGLQKALFHVSAQGQLLHTFRVKHPVRALAVDPTRSRTWVGTEKHTLTAYDEAGRIVATIDLGDHADVQDLDVDPLSGDLWVALKDRRLRRYDADGQWRVEVPVKHLERVASDGVGGVWMAAADRELLRLDAAGQTLLAIRPFAKRDRVVALVADPSDQSAWVATRRAVRHISAEGDLLHEVALWPGLTVRDLALYVDLIPPVLSLTAPAEGSFVNRNTPQVELTYSDIGSGVDQATLQLAANGQPLRVACTPGEGGASCLPSTPLPEGPITLSATVKDRAANSSAPAEVRFTVDTIPPRLTLTAPPNGLLTNQPSQPVRGEVSEAATLTLRLNGQAVETVVLAAAAPFTASPITLTEGPNTLELVALDRAGNVGRASAALTLDTVPPAAVALLALTVGQVIDGQVSVSGAAGSAEPGARVTITNLRTGLAVTVVAGTDGRFTATIAAQPGDPIRVTATDGAGNTSAPVAASVPAAVRVTITEPAAGAAVAAGDLLVRGNVEGGGAEVGVTVGGVVAAVHGGTFVALVPVLPGAAGLTAVATTAGGVTARHVVTLTVVAQPGPEVLLTVSPPAGVAPLTAAFSLAGEAAAGAVQADFDGNSTIDFTGPSLDGQTFVYSAPGIYIPTVTATDTQGSTRTARAIVQIYDPALLEVLLQAKWAAMKEALRRGDIPAALAVVAERSRARYQAAFTALAPDLPAIDTILTDLTFVRVRGREAIFEMRRTDEGFLKSFEVRFVIDADGIWRLRAF